MIQDSKACSQVRNVRERIASSRAARFEAGSINSVELCCDFCFEACGGEVEVESVLLLSFLQIICVLLFWLQAFVLWLLCVGIPFMASSSSVLLSPEAESAVCHLESLGKASAVLNESYGNQVAVACEAAKDMLLTRARAFVDSSAGMPLLSSKSCDGTPIRASVYTRTKLPSGKIVKGHAKRGLEILVSNEFLRFEDPAEGWQTACIVSEPVPLSGKTVPEILGAARVTWQTLRHLGARGCTLEHYVWDRLGIESLEKQCRAWHQHQLLPENPAYDKEDWERMEMVVVTPCALHDSHNAFRWAFLQQVKDRSLMRDLYISVESLRNSADLLSSHMASWILSVLTFVDAQDEIWVQEYRVLWESLDVEPSLIELLAAELQLRWEGGRLCVKAQAQVCPH